MILLILVFTKIAIISSCHEEEQNRSAKVSHNIQVKMANNYFLQDDNKNKHQKFTLENSGSC